jgi:putative membrane protein
MKILIRWLILALSILIASFIVPGISADSFGTILLVAAIFGLITLFIKPILVILTLPINILTLGLFTLVINGILFALAASFVDGFQVAGLISAILGGLVISVMHVIFHFIIKD